MQDTATTTHKSSSFGPLRQTAAASPQYPEYRSKPAAFIDYLTATNPFGSFAAMSGAAPVQ
jgi:hypothetical protein